MNDETKKNNKPKVYVWDIETTELQADRGHILCACVYDLNNKELTTFRVDESGDKPYEDLNLVRALASKLDDADVWVTQYGARFDCPFVQTRIAFWRGQGNRDLKFMRPVPHVDLWRTSKYRLAMRNNRLQTLADLLGRGRKTYLDLRVWRKAERGDKPSLDSVVKHCEVDIGITAKCYTDVRPLIAAHPHIGALIHGTRRLSCAGCGSKRVHSRGTYATAMGLRRRVYCNSCGKWGNCPVGKK